MKRCVRHTFQAEVRHVVTFRNGQHRARYLAFAGATSLPVEVHETEAALLERYCGP